MTAAVTADLFVKAHRLPWNCSRATLPGTDEQADSSTVGFLPPGYAVFKTGGSPADPDWRVPNLGLLAGIDERRFKDRRDLLSAPRAAAPDALTADGGRADRPQGRCARSRPG